MATVIPFDGSSAICFCVFKPSGACADDLVDSLACLSNFFENSDDSLQSFILRSIHGNLVVWCGSWTNGCDTDKALSTLPSAEEFRKMISPMAHIMHANWFESFCGQTKNGSAGAKIKRGDIVTMRAVVTESEKQESLCYACLALLKSFFGKIKGISSHTSFRSLDGEKVVALTEWEKLEEAYAWILDSHSYSEKSMEPYVKDFIIDTQYDLMEVVYATPHTF
eukprot:Gb_13341 [translate_table: standard]